MGFSWRSQVIVLPIPKQFKPLINANLVSLNELFGPHVSFRLAFVKGLGCFSIGKTMVWRSVKALISLAENERILPVRNG